MEEIKGYEAKQEDKIIPIKESDLKSTYNNGCSDVRKTLRDMFPGTFPVLLNAESLEVELLGDHLLLSLKGIDESNLLRINIHTGRVYRVAGISPRTGFDLDCNGRLKLAPEQLDPPTCQVEATDPA